jgi:hypothetical protein
MQTCSEIKKTDDLFWDLGYGILKLQFSLSRFPLILLPDNVKLPKNIKYQSFRFDLKKYPMSIIKKVLPLILIVLFASACETERQRPIFEYDFNNPADVGSRYANLYQDNEGRIYISWIMGIEEDIFAIQYSTFYRNQWTMPQTVRVSTDFFVNWADFPSVVGLNGEVVAAHWLRKIEGGPYAYNVNLAFPGEDGQRWTEPVTPHLDGTATEHGFVSLEPLDTNRVLAIWLDGRNTEGRAHHEYEDFSKAMTLRSAEISSDGEISRKRIIDEAVCDCCQTDLVAVDGGFLAVYRDRTEEEIRDISIARYDLETGEWSQPRPVWNDGWEIRACPVNGPRIDANGNRVAVAWFTLADNDPIVRVALSADAGETFDEPISIAGNNALGRVDTFITDEGSVFVSWLEQSGDFARVMIREIKPDGVLSRPIHVGTTEPSRASGFPRMAPAGDHILIAWTQTAPQLRVRTALVPLSDFVRDESDVS